MLNLITLASCGVIFYCITDYDKCGRFKLSISLLAYVLAFVAGAHAIEVLFGRVVPNIYSTFGFFVIAIATYHHRGNVACFFRSGDA